MPTIGLASEVSQYSSSEECFETARSWLADCVDNHTQCKPLREPPLPTRVIDVGLGGSRDPFLLESSGQTGKYIALSYCWGKNDRVLKTTAQNLESHKKRIPFASLPKTLQDAVTISRRLGIQYLWIDALCIIQGDPVDWAREAGKMCLVYSFSHLTVSAANSPGSSHGCFRLQKFGTPPRVLTYGASPVYVRRNIAREHARDAIFARLSSEPLPVNCRAWTLQEAMLSNRILYYAADELVWECNEWYHCECSHDSGKIIDEDGLSNRGIRRLQLVPSGITLQQIYRKWDDIVMLFSERQLSVDDDRLAALSGLASQVQLLLRHVSGGKEHVYLAGLWKENLAQGLLWSVEDDMAREGRDVEMEYRRPGSWRAPSWSWASFEGPIQYHPLSRFESTILIDEVSTSPQTPYDNTGQIRSAKLVVTGPVVHNVRITLRDPEPRVTHWVGKGAVAYPMICDDPSPIFETGDVYSCLLVGIVNWWGPLKRHFLVLQPSGVVDGAFERVGVSCKPHLRGGEHCPLFSNGSREQVTII